MHQNPKTDTAASINFNAPWYTNRQKAKTTQKKSTLVITVVGSRAMMMIVSKTLQKTESVTEHFL